MRTPLEEQLEVPALNRLQEKDIKPGCMGLFVVRSPAVAGYGDQESSVELPVLPHDYGDLAAVDFRHGDINERDVRQEFERCGEGLRGLGDNPHLMLPHVKQGGEEVVRFLIPVDDEHSHLPPLHSVGLSVLRGYSGPFSSSAGCTRIASLSPLEVS